MLSLDFSLLKLKPFWLAVHLFLGWSGAVPHNGLAEDTVHLLEHITSPFLGYYHKFHFSADQNSSVWYGT